MKPPVGAWLFGYRREWLPADIVAGLSTAAIVIPKAMAYALIAGLTVEAGLYTALAAMLVYPLLGSSRALSVSTTSALAMLTAASVAALSLETSGADAAAVTATLALLVGGVLIAARLLRLGFLANFISLPVLVGFEAGVGIVIIIGQLKSVLGVHVESKTTIGTLLEIPQLLPQAHGATVLVAAVAIGSLLVLEHRFRRWPIPLLLVAVSIAASFLFGLEALGVKTVGAFPPGLPSFRMPDWSLAAVLWPAALGIALMSFTESVAAARTFWQRGDAPVSANQELLAVGAANIAVAAVGGLPAGGGTSQTAVAEQAGARSQLAQWVNAAAVLTTLLFLASAMAALPEAALAAVIIVAAVGMIKLRNFTAIARVRRDELMWAIATVAAVVLIGTLEGILIAVVISMLTLIYQANHPPVYAVAYSRDERIFRRVGENSRDEIFPGLLILRTEGRLTFANAANARDKMQKLIEETKPRVIALECSGIPDIEYTALTMLADAEQRLRTQGVALWLVAVNPDVMPMLARSTLAAASDPAVVFANLHKALEAWQRVGEVAGRKDPAPRDESSMVAPLVSTEPRSTL